MPRGGKRQGAGRPKGSQNQKTAELRAEIAASGELPLDYMLRVMRDPNAEPHRRDAMSKAAAPYVHRPLAPQGDYEMLWRRQLWQLSLVELRALKARYLQAAPTPLIEQQPLQNGDGEKDVYNCICRLQKYWGAGNGKHRICKGKHQRPRPGRTNDGSARGGLHQGLCGEDQRCPQ